MVSRLTSKPNSLLLFFGLGVIKWEGYFRFSVHKLAVGQPFGWGESFYAKAQKLATYQVLATSLLVSFGACPKL